jgi:DNA-binding CsgD family transcriptional regulator
LELPLDLSLSPDSLMWIIDRDMVLRAVTEATLDILNMGRDEVVGRTIGEWDPIQTCYPANMRIARLEHVFNTGQPDTLMDWEELPSVGWRKMVFTSARLGDNHCLTVAGDITDTDPKSSWLARIDVERECMYLGEAYGNQIMSFSEYAVLHGLLFHHTYLEIAEHLGIGESTVSHRIKQLKEMFGVTTPAGLMREISRNGLIHMMSLEPAQFQPLKTQLELYRAKGGLPKPDE